MRLAAAPALLVGGGVIVSLILRVAPPANALVLTAAGALISWSLARRTGGAFLVRVVLSSYFLVIVLTVTLYAVSAWQLPILEKTQLGGGFWTFAWDAPSYDRVASQMVDASLGRGPFPSRAVPEYYALAALVYFVWGRHPLNAIIPNAIFHSVLVVTSFAIGQRLFGGRPARLTAVLVAFWPSLILWSSQLLRDTLVLLLVFAALRLVVSGLNPSAFAGWPRGRTLAWWSAYVFVVVLTYRLRFYVVLFLAAALLVATLSTLVPRPNGRSFVRAALLTGVLLSATVGMERITALLPSAAIGGGAPGTAPPHSALAGQAPPPTGVGGLVAKLEDYRQGSIRAGGRLFDADVSFHDSTDIIRYLPRALARGFFSPYPSEWRHGDSTTGALTAAASVETVIMCALAIPFAIGAIVAATSGLPARIALLVYIVVAASVIPITVANLGTLFRLRLVFLMPAMVLVGGGIEWLAAKRARSET